MAQQTDEKGKPLTYWGGVEKSKQEILIPVIPNVECRDGKEIGVWMEGWLEGYKEAQGQYEITSSARELHQYKLGLDDGYNKAKETLYTKQDLIDLVQGLKDYTKESHTILGHDDREASEFVDIFLDYSNYQDND